MIPFPAAKSDLILYTTETYMFYFEISFKQSIKMHANEFGSLLHAFLVKNDLEVSFYDRPCFCTHTDEVNQPET